MAQRGAKPKPDHLRLVDGTHRKDRHGSKKDAEARIASGAKRFSTLRRPSFLKGEARKAWERYVDPCDWLDISKEPAAVMFCELWAEYREHPRGFLANKIAQMRSLMSELGLTDERNRGTSDSPGARDEFFDD